MITFNKWKWKESNCTIFVAAQFPICVTFYKGLLHFAGNGDCCQFEMVPCSQQKGFDGIKDFSRMSTLHDNSGPALRIHQLPRGSIVPLLHPPLDNFHFLYKISENYCNKFTFSHFTRSYISFILIHCNMVCLKLVTLGFSQQVRISEIAFNCKLNNKALKKMDSKKQPISWKENKSIIKIFIFEYEELMPQHAEAGQWFLENGCNSYFKEILIWKIKRF